jgi:anti-sigma factor RsiW
MNCRGIMEVAPLYLSRELQGEQRVLFEAHLAECRDCAREVEQQMAADTALREGLAAPLPNSAQVEGSVRKQLARVRSHRWIMTAAAAVAVLAISKYGLLRSSPATQIFLDAAEDHRVEVAEHQPRRWRTDPAEIEILTARYPLPSVATLAPEGYRLEKAKMCRLNGQPALHLVYTNGSTEVSVFVRSQTGSAHGVRMTGAGLASFQNDRVEVIAASGSTGECLEFARIAAAKL